MLNENLKHMGIWRQ